MASNNRSGSLNLLQDYDSESDSDSGYRSDQEKKRKCDVDEVEIPNIFEKRKKKRKHSEGEEMEVEKFCDIEATLAQSVNSTKSPSRLQNVPLPHEFQIHKAEYIDDPAQHEGRIRGFAHERGLWPSHLYIPLSFETSEPVMKSMIQALCVACADKDISLTPINDHHISLSKTLALRLHWIQPMLNYLRSHLKNILKFSVWLHGLQVFTNDEKTRTFIGLGVFRGSTELEEIVSVVDLCLQEYGLPIFYDEKMFHMSLAWCNGDRSKDIEPCLLLLDNICQQYFNIETEIRTFEASTIGFKTGNRLHNIELRDSIS